MLFQNISLSKFRGYEEYIDKHIEHTAIRDKKLVPVSATSKKERSLDY